ncbi:MAG TPA: fatty acyl-AMP ligase, partial [Isosphaeraceae bacterium]
MRDRTDDHDSRLTFIEILGRSAGDPGIAFRFVTADGDGPADAISYGALDLRARAIAARLTSLGLAGERALLVYSPGLEFVSAFFGCLYAGVIAVPAHPPRPNRPAARLGAIAADARPRAVLTSARLLPESARWAAEVNGLEALDRVATDAVGDDDAAAWHHPGAGPNDLAFLQYTSGSTASPKGVMVSHANLVANSAQIRSCFGSTAESRGVFWLPLFHDMGLIGGVLQTVYCGGSSTLLSPVAFLQRPLRWLEAISSTGATISGGPDFAYDLCVRKIGPEARAGLDLSRWSVAFNGAEPIRPETLDRFAEAFAPCGFRREAFLPCYGLAEATLLVSGRRSTGSPFILHASGAALGEDRVEPAAADDERRLVGSGSVPEGTYVVIVNPATATPCAPGRVGEVWVRGPGVARGYWDREGASSETFGATLPGYGTQPFLRTGDLGFLRGGELYVTGRLKDLIIIGGRNLYPQDVERTAEVSHPSVRAGGVAAFAVELGGRERLVIAAEVDRAGTGDRASEVITAIRGAVVGAHEVELHAIRLLKPMALPRTSSGKLQRHACRTSFFNNELESVCSWTQEIGTSALAGGSPPGGAGVPARSTDATLG